MGPPRRRPEARAPENRRPGARRPAGQPGARPKWARANSSVLLQFVPIVALVCMSGAQINLAIGLIELRQRIGLSNILIALQVGALQCH